MDLDSYSEIILQNLEKAEAIASVAVQVVLIFVGGFIAAKFLKKQSKKLLSKLAHADETLVQFVSGVVYYAVMILTIVASLGKMGVPTTSIAAALGAAGLAIGLALQNTLANIAAGLMLLILRPFKIGEYVEAGDTQGTIELIGLFSAQLKDINGLYLMAPNSQMWSKTIKNYSRNQTRRAVVSVGVSYGSNLKNAQDLILDYLSQHKQVHKQPEPQVLVDSLGDSSVNLQVRFWVDSSDYLSFKSTATTELKNLLDENKIEIPFPQRELLIKNSENLSN